MIDAAAKLDVLDAGDWQRYLLQHGSHERLYAFLDVLDNVGLGLMSDADYWRALRETWEMSDVVYRDLPTWRALFRSRRPDREHLMTEAERVHLAGLPDRVTIHRGSGDWSGRLGLSWTLDLERAQFFARDFARSPRLAWLGVPRPEGSFVTTVTVRRERLLACLDDRDEAEVIVPNLRGYRPRVSGAFANGLQIGVP